MILNLVFSSVLLLCFIQCTVCKEGKSNTKPRIKSLFNNHRNNHNNQKLAMERHSVVPDVIDSVPKNTIKISYPSGVTVNLGNELTPTSVKDEPQLEWPVEAGALYTLSMSDPDAPSRQDPKFGEFKHWLVVNIPGLDINNGQTLAEYIGSGPPKDTGLHRYIFVVYKQQTNLEISETPISNRSREGRRSFKIRDFAKKYNLGEPIAGNFYLAQYDDYVPILHAQLS